MEGTMGFFGTIFWIVVFWMVFSVWRRHRWERWATFGPRGYVDRWSPREWSGRGQERETRRERLKQGDQQEYVDSLETRVSQLEERLDFTERLLADRPGASQA
jgi:Na+/melibiose symporter-like transporter